MIRIEDQDKTRQDLLSELAAYRQWNAHLQSEAHGAKKARQELKEVQNIFEKLAEISGDGVALYSATRFIRVNPAMVQMAGVSLNDLLSQSPVEFFTTEVFEQISDAESGEKITLKLSTAGQKVANVFKVNYQDQAATMLVISTK